MKDAITVPLGSLANEITVGFVGPMAKEYVPYGVPFLRSQNVKPFRFDPDDIKFISTRFHAKIGKSKLSPGDVAVVRTGNPGTACVIPDSLPEANCSDLVIIRCGEGLDPDFVSYYINSVTHSHVRNQSVGAIQKHFNVGSAKELPFPNLRRDAQRRISKVLSTLDTKIELNHRINQELEGLAKLLYDYWFVQFDFPISAEQAAAMGDPTLQGKPYRQSGGKMTYNPTLKREIPEGWRAGNILDVSKLGGGGTPSKEKPNWWNGDILFFTPTDTTNEVFCLTTEEKITDEGLNKSATKLYPAGTIFITARGSVGRVVITASDSAMSQSCYALQPITRVSSGFLYFHIHALMGYLKAKSSGSVFKSIVTNDLQFSPSVVPPLELMASFGNRTSAIFSQILNNQKQNQELATLRDWLLPMLMNGQVTVAP